MDEAQRAYRQCRFDDCFEGMERARRMAPADINILIEIGNCYVRRHEGNKAREYFDRAVKLSSKKTATLEIIGTRCRDASDFEMGRQYLEQAATQADVTPFGLATLAWVYERLRRLEDANSVADRALKKDPDSPAAIIVKARADNLAGRKEDAVARLRAFTTSRNEVAARIRAAYDLASILDKMGRYDEAMDALQQAKALNKPNSAKPLAELKIIRERLQEAADCLTPEVLQRWYELQGHLKPTARLALLGGHPRSGTTLLEQVLDTHSDIISAEETELFNDDAYVPLFPLHPKISPIFETLDTATAEMLEQSRKRYLKQTEIFLGEPVGGRLLVDKNPSLTFLVPAMARIFPETKFLIALRDPRDICISCFMVPSALNQVSAAWLTLEGTTDEYIALMTGWRKIAPKLLNPHLEVRYEDMVADLEPVARKTLEFLEVSWDPKVLGFDEHARQKAVRSPTYSDVTKKVFKTAVGRWRNYQKYFEPHLAKLEPLVKALGYE